jgi:L-amino acid N-acyltransferase YncA
VVEEERRRGIGKALLAFVERAASDAGWDVVYSSSDADEPEPQAWHRHVGFEECGFFAGHNPGGVGEVFFRKRLA